MEELEKKVNFVEESDKLLQLFKEFEEVVKQKCIKLGIKTDEMDIKSLIEELCKKDKYFKSKEKEINIIRIIRNINSHNWGGGYKYVVYPSPEINNRLEKIINEIKKPPMIYDSSICIKRKNIYCKNLDDCIYETIKVMSEKMYTHIPILENEKLIGIFSENTLLDVVKDESGIVIDEKTKFSDIKDYLKIENHSMEEFIFVSRKKDIYDIEEIFKNYFSKNKRIGCVFVTDNGKSTETILGMLTAWDVLGN